MSKTVLPILFLIIISFISGFFIRNYLPDKYQPPGNMSLSPTPTLSLFLVIKVFDGDTIQIEGGEKVRYLGIDAPEPNDAYGISAQRYNQQLVLGRKARLEEDYETHDKYGRRLAYVWLDNVLINEKMIEEGYAKVYTISKTRKLKYVKRLEEAEQYAREHHNGMWLEEWKE